MPIPKYDEMGIGGGQSSLLTLGLAVVIRCLLRPSNELRRAMEMLNRYIDGAKKRDQTTDLRYREFVTRNRSRRAWKPRGHRAAPITRRLMHRKRLTIE